MSTFLPSTRKWPWRTSCRASAREVANPIRYTMLSRRCSKQQEQGLAGDATGAFGKREVAAELAFHEAVHALHLLLLAQLHGVLGELAAPLPVIAGRVVAPLDGALVRVAAFAFEKQLQALTPAEPADRIGITSQR